MIGTVVNAIAIVTGGSIGLLAARLSRKTSKGESRVIDGVRQVLGLATIILGVQMALEELTSCLWW